MYNKIDIVIFQLLEKKNDALSLFSYIEKNISAKRNLIQAREESGLTIAL